jgi:hypothetical protein
MTPRRKPEASSENAVVVAHHIPAVYNKELALDAPTKSPMKRVIDGRITKARKEQILVNLETECEFSLLRLLRLHSYFVGTVFSAPNLALLVTRELWALGWVPTIKPRECRAECVPRETEL